NCMTDEVTEIPRCCSRRIQSEVAWRAALRPFTVPAIWMAPPNSSSFSVSVVLPASGWEMMAKVLRCRIWSAIVSVTIGESFGKWAAGCVAVHDTKARAGRTSRQIARPCLHEKAVLPRAELVRLLEFHVEEHRACHK